MKLFFNIGFGFILSFFHINVCSVWFPVTLSQSVSASQLVWLMMPVSVAVAVGVSYTVLKYT